MCRCNVQRVGTASLEGMEKAERLLTRRMSLQAADSMRDLHGTKEAPGRASERGKGKKKAAPATTRV